MQKQQGFTLIEVMIVVAILGIVAALAYSSYSQQVLKSGRSDAKVALSDVAQRMQRCFTTNSTYKPAAAGTCTVVDEVTSAAGIESTEGYYVISLLAADHEDAAYELRAEPAAGSRQANDDSCVLFTLNQAGVRYAEDSGGVDNTDECW